MTQAIPVREIHAAGSLENWLRRRGATVAKNATTQKPMPVPPARGRAPKDSLAGYDAERMNKLETKYAAYLEGLRRAGKIVFWKFEAVKLRLADGTFYTPDFFVMLPDGSTGFHETKGFWRDDARAKIKIAAELFPWWFFVAVTWEAKAKDWKFEKFRNL